MMGVGRKAPGPGSEEALVAPAAARAALGVAGVDLSALVRVPRSGRERSLGVLAGGGIALVIARDSKGRRDNLTEAASRRVASDAGIAVPAILAVAPAGEWLITDWVEAQPARGEQYVLAALRAADAIMAIPWEARPAIHKTWAAPRAGRVARVARLVAGGMSLRSFREARAAAGLLSVQSLAHGDFYPRNVLHRTSGGVAVVDWEFFGPAPAFTDHIRFWSILKDPGDRAVALESILAGRSPREAAEVGVLARWLTLRLLAENLSAPGAARNEENLDHARSSVDWGQALYEATRLRTRRATEPVELAGESEP